MVAVTGEAVAQRIQRYVLDRSDEDLRRLLEMAQVTEDVARVAFGRVGVQHEWTAIDCGCGPFGGLAVLAQLVGATGRVVGIDSVRACIDVACLVIASLGLDNVELVIGDVNADASELLAEHWFDVAFSRCFLTDQPEPARTLRRIASMLRPGGWIVVQEPLRSPPPRSSPRCEALTAYWELLHEVIETAGVPHEIVDSLPAAARAADLNVVARNGVFIPTAAPLGFDLTLRPRRAPTPVDHVKLVCIKGHSCTPSVDQLLLSEPDGDQARALATAIRSGRSAVSRTVLREPGERG